MLYHFLLFCFLFSSFTNKGNEIYYREGTYGQPGYEGTDWIQVEHSLKSISVGDDIVVGCNEDDVMYARMGQY